MKIDTPVAICANCRRNMPVWSHRCLFCGEPFADVVASDGQLAFKARSDGSCAVFAVTRRGEQLEAVDSPIVPDQVYREPVVARVVVRGRTGDVEVTIPLHDIVTAFQRSEEVVDVA